MNWPTYYLELRRNIERKLSDLSPLLKPVERLHQAIRVVVPAITEVRTLFKSQPPSGQGEEILFFKEIKPWFTALKIYEVEVFQLMNERPVSTREHLTIYFEEELSQVQRFFRQHSFYYQYYRKGPQELNQLFFLRGTTVDDLSVPECSSDDQNYQTALDCLFAHFIAKEWLRDFILMQLKNPSAVNDPAKTENAAREIKWTGEAVNLFEIAVGVNIAGQVNNGNATLSEIVRWLEQSLDVTIGRPNKRWNEISSRTRTSPTKFLQRMQDGIRNRIDDELDASKATRRARRTGD